LIFFKKLFYNEIILKNMEENIVRSGLYQKLQREAGFRRYGKAHEEIDFTGGAVGFAETETFSSVVDLLAQYGRNVDTSPSPLDNLQKEYRLLQEEIAGLDPDEKRRELLEQSFGRLYGYAWQARQLRREINTITEQQKKETLASLADPDRVNAATVTIQGKREAYLQELKAALEEDLPFVDPESFLAHHLLKIRALKREFAETNLMTVDSVEAYRKQILEKLTEKKIGIAALVGETGTGKTKMAKKVAEAVYRQTHKDEKDEKPYYFIPGHKYTSKEDLLGHLGVAAEATKPEEAMKQVEEAQEAQRQLWEAEGTGLVRAEQKQYLEDIKKIILGQSQQVRLKTQEFLGVVQRAKKEGKVLIIDEFNYIEPGLIAALNEHVEEGLKVIFTGNLTLTRTERYLDRQKFDPALLNRINSGLIEYHTPSMQDIDSPSPFTAEALVSNSDRKEGASPPNRELYKIALAQLVDKKGNLYAPEDALEQVWKMTQAFKIFQNNFAGVSTRDKDGKDVFEDASGAQLLLKKTHASMRTMNEILDRWKGDGFSLPLDYYFYEYLLRPAAIIAPREAGYYLHILGKDRYGFFTQADASGTKIWENYLQVSAEGELAVLASPDKALFKTTQKETNLKLFSAQEVAEAFSGYQMPEEIEKVVREKLQETGILPEQEVMEKSAEMEAELQELKDWARAFGGYGVDEEEQRKIEEEGGIPEVSTLKLFCMDETNIKTAAS
jgi:MoxR-like ATPase